MDKGLIVDMRVRPSCVWKGSRDGLSRDRVSFVDVRIDVSSAIMPLSGMNGHP